MAFTSIHTDNVIDALRVSAFDILPPVDNIWSLGSATYSFKDLHVQTLVYATSVQGNWSPDADDTYDLGTSLLQWKDIYVDGIAYIDTLYVEVAGRVNDDILFSFGTGDDIVMLNRSTQLATNTALAGALIGTPVTPALTANSLIISNVTADGDILIAGNDGGHSRVALYFDSSTPDTYLYNVGGTWTAGATTWTIPAVTLGGLVSAGASGRISLSGATLDVADNDISLINIGSYDTALASTTKPTANTFVSSLNVSQSIDADSDIWFVGTYTKLMPITNAQTHNSFVSTMVRMDIGVVVDSAYGLQSHVKFSGTGAVAADGEVIGLSGQIYGTVNTSQGLFWAVKGDLRATSTPAGRGESAAGFFVTTVSAGQVVRVSNLSGATVQDGIGIHNAGTMTNGIYMLGTITTGIELSDATLTNDIVFQAGTLFKDSASGLEVGIDSTGFGLKFYDNAIIFGDSTNSWDLSLRFYDASTLEIRNAADSANASLKLDDLIFYSDIKSDSATAYIKARAAEGAAIILQAFDTGNANVEIAKMVGAADPYFSMGGSQEFKFYNSGYGTITPSADYGLKFDGTIDSACGIYGLHSQVNAFYAGIWYEVSSTATSGDVTAIRGRALGNAASAGANVRGGYFEAKMSAASKYAAMLEGCLSHADYSPGSITVSGDVRGFIAHISQGSGLNAANLYGILISIQTRGDESITSDDVGLCIKNEAVGGAGREMDAAILIKEVNVTANGFALGIDFTGADYTTAALKLGAGHNILLDTGTGTKIGTATNQKLGFYNATPVSQPTGTAVVTENYAGTGDLDTEAELAAAINANGAAINVIRTALNALGLTTTV